MFNYLGNLRMQSKKEAGTLSILIASFLKMNKYRIG
jgi:hypothetical protein